MKVWVGTMNLAFRKYRAFFADSAYNDPFVRTVEWGNSRCDSRNISLKATQWLVWKHWAGVRNCPASRRETFFPSSFAVVVQNYEMISCKFRDIMSIMAFCSKCCVYFFNLVLSVNTLGNARSRNRSFVETECSATAGKQVLCFPKFALLANSEMSW